MHGGEEAKSDLVGEALDHQCVPPRGGTRARLVVTEFQ